MRVGDSYRKKCKRHNIAGHAHELTFSCSHNRPFLLSERTRSYRADAIAVARNRHDFDLWAYVLMPEHVHLLICPRTQVYSVSQILRSIKQSVSRRATIYLRQNNPEGLQSLATGQKRSVYRFWRAGGGYDRNMVSVETILNVVRYIHDNPVRRGLVQHANDWPYSSARDWDGAGNGPIPVDFDTFPVV